MLARMQANRSAYLLLVEMVNGAATPEDRVVVSYKAKQNHMMQHLGF